MASKEANDAAGAAVKTTAAQKKAQGKQAAEAAEAAAAAAAAAAAEAAEAAQAKKKEAKEEKAAAKKKAQEMPPEKNELGEVVTGKNNNWGITHLTKMNLEELQKVHVASQYVHVIPTRGSV